MIWIVPAGADSPYRERIEALNAEAFPEPERTSYDDMLLAEKAGCGGLFAALEDGEFIGFTYCSGRKESFTSTIWPSSLPSGAEGAGPASSVPWRRCIRGASWP
ncbi:hypothetical protein AUQ37_08465 [Candidatus Methanomethylophilus sp. 1R26]|uniref:hypothetical protein n=1 Tax=Candidatus Methanomethylophilus sp. 1R26 TaxID=1769296 RepID=UPI000736D773|nr:hypothetical protein [Candidatus Methanomethylophilus sp. 1R26]KUE73544.1 hypothetical protein AUQ37_08465 [Candidatus Methanomethylophilus sp. 1R26]